MVKRAISLVVGKISSFREAAFWLSLFALFSQILALLRDRLLAYHFGAGTELDVYYAAFKIPDIIFVTVASLVSISALVPLFAKKETEGEKHLKEATESMFTIFSIMIVATTIAAFFVMPAIISRVFSGFSIELQQDTILFSRILLLSPLLLGFSNFFGSIVQYEKRFVLYSLSPILYNIGIVFGLVLFVEEWGIMSAVIGVVFGALLHFGLQAAFVYLSPKSPQFTFKINWEVVYDTAKISVPRTFALSIVSFVALFFASIASRLGEGSITVFNFSWNLQSVPLSLIGVSFSLAAFPSLSVSAARKNIEEIIEKMSDGLRQIIFWSLPFSALIIVLRAHIVRLVLGSGDFDWAATRLVAASLSLFVVSAVFQSIQLFLSRSHYALGKTKWPLLGNILGAVVSISVAVIFLGALEDFSPVFSSIYSFLKVADLPNKILLLPIAFTVGSIISAAFLFLSLDREIYSQIWRRIKVSATKSFVASLFFGAGAYLGLYLLDGFFNLDKFLGVLGHGAFAFLCGVAVGVSSLYLIGSKDFADFINAFQAKMKSLKSTD